MMRGCVVIRCVEKVLIKGVIGRVKWLYFIKCVDGVS